MSLVDENTKPPPPVSQPSRPAASRVATGQQPPLSLPTPASTTAKNHVRITGSALGASSVFPQAPEQTSSPTSISSSLFSSTPTLSSISSTHYPIAHRVLYEPSRNAFPLPVHLASDTAREATVQSESSGGGRGDGSSSFAIPPSSRGRSRGSLETRRTSTPVSDDSFVTSAKKQTDDAVLLSASCPTTSTAFPLASGTTQILSDSSHSFKRQRRSPSPPLSLPTLLWRPLPSHSASSLRRDCHSAPVASTSFPPPSPGLAELPSLGSGSDSDSDRKPTAMTGCLHDKQDRETVEGRLPDKENETATESSSILSSLQTRALPSPMIPLNDFDLIELLDQDDRPTFVVDAASTTHQQSGPLHIMFKNATLCANPSLVERLVSTATTDDSVRLKKWTLSLGPDHNRSTVSSVPSTTMTFAGLTWSSSTLRRRYRIIRGSSVTKNPVDSVSVIRKTAADAISPPEAILEPAEQHTSIDDSEKLPENEIPTSTKEKGPAILSIDEDDAKHSFDWTRIAITENVPEFTRFCRSVNWAATSLGPIENWSADLRFVSSLVMGSSHPVALYWGPDFTIIYNKAYVSVAGHKHPWLMGSNYTEGWPETWDVMGPVLRSAWDTGQAVFRENSRVFLDRYGYLEETYFNWSIVPLTDRTGSVVALLNPAFDNTWRKINERRMLTLNEIGEKTAAAQTVPHFWQAVQAGLKYNEYDAPFVLLYSASCCDGANDDIDSEISSMHPSSATGPPSVTLDGSLGVPVGHAIALPVMDLRTCNDGFAPYMRDAMALAATDSGGSSSAATTPPPVVLSVENGTLPAHLVDGIQGKRGFDDPIRTVVVFPIQHPTAPGSASAAAVSGFVILGTNPRRPYNRDYKLFVHILARQLTTSLASVVLFEEEVRHSRRAARQAAQDRRELSQQLRLRTQQAVDSENKFMLMAEFTPVGMFVTDATGRITYCNDMWWKISQHPRTPAIDSPSASSYLADLDKKQAAWLTWMDSVQEDDLPDLVSVWNRLINEKVAATHEFRFKHSTTIQTDNSDKPLKATTWVLLRAYPEKDELGNLKRIFGCITDISKQKLAEECQSRLLQEAVEHKRQQESFIDITSHEMRNPLSAILQSVDEIMNSVAEYQSKFSKDGVSDGDTKALLCSIAEASGTISLCANHQKRIVDDVLTLSKLDSQLLPVMPVDVQPVMVVHHTIKMFESDLQGNGISCVLHLLPSFKTLVGVESCVKLDPSRLNQVLVNLLANAVKFTQTCELRTIDISLGAFDVHQEPTQNDVVNSLPDMYYVPSRQDTQKLADGPGWGDGQKINLHIAVSNSGQGLHEEEKTVLFQQFSRTTPRTHVQYGGSGLGLYISRHLAELQGGQIGVASSKGHGSTFAFYVQCRKVPSTTTEFRPSSSDLPSIVSVPSSANEQHSAIDCMTYGSKDGAGTFQDRTKKGTSPTLVPRVLLQPMLLPYPVEPAVIPSEDKTPSHAIASAPQITKGRAETAVIASDYATPANRNENETFKSLNAADLNVLIVEDNLVNQQVLQRQLDKRGSRTLVANHGGEALDLLRLSTFWQSTGYNNGRAKGTADAATDATTEADLMVTDGVTTRPAAVAVDTTLAAPSLTNSGRQTSSSSSASVTGVGTPRRLAIDISVILMDLEMPVMDGMTCARAIRALERSGTLVRHVPIIAVTAYARSELIENAKAAGIDDVISKPFRLTQLMPKIEELVAKYETV